MAVPSFHLFFRPILEFLADGQTRTRPEIKQAAIDALALSIEDQSLMLDSGNDSVAKNRASWAISHLKAAGLLESEKWGCWKITPAGEKYVAVAPAIIALKDLDQFSGHHKFYSTKSSNEKSIPIIILKSEEKSLDEEVEAVHELLFTQLADELLTLVKNMSPQQFERLVVQFMLKLGYGGGLSESGKTVGKSGDGGIDGVINQDKLGLDKIYLQAKCWKDVKVGNKEVQSFVGALSGQGATKGVFITTSTFTPDALTYAKKYLNVKISLVDGHELVRLMIENDLGVSLKQRFDVKQVDSDFFVEE